MHSSNSLRPNHLSEPPRSGLALPQQIKLMPKLLDMLRLTPDMECFMPCTLYALCSSASWLSELDYAFGTY